MRTKIFFYSMLTVAISFASCGDDDDETCEKDEVCEATITVCCTSETECKYNVDGTDYDSLEDASESLECTASAAPDGDKSRVLQSLQSLATRAKANL